MSTDAVLRASSTSPVATRVHSRILLRVDKEFAEVGAMVRLWLEQRGRSVESPPDLPFDTSRHADEMKFWLRECSDYVLITSWQSLGGGLALLETGIAVGAGKSATWMLPSTDRLAAAELCGGAVNIEFFDASDLSERGVLSIDDTHNPLFIQAPIDE